MSDELCQVNDLFTVGNGDHAALRLVIRTFRVPPIMHNYVFSISYLIKEENNFKLSQASVIYAGGTLTEE